MITMYVAHLVLGQVTVGIVLVGYTTTIFGSSSMMVI